MDPHYIYNIWLHIVEADIPGQFLVLAAKHLVQLREYNQLNHFIERQYLRDCVINGYSWGKHMVTF